MHVAFVADAKYDSEESFPAAASKHESSTLMSMHTYTHLYVQVCVYI